MTSLAPTKSARIPDICTKICSINTGSVMQSYPSCMRVVFCYSKQSKIIRNKTKFVIKGLSYEYEIVLICSQTGNSVHQTAFYPWFCQYLALLFCITTFNKDQVNPARGENARKRAYCLARSTKTAILRRLFFWQMVAVTVCATFYCRLGILTAYRPRSLSG